MKFVKKLELYIRKHPRVLYFASFFYCLFGMNITRGLHKQNVIKRNGAFIKHFNVKFYGSHNSIEIEEGVRLRNCLIQVFSDNNQIRIGHDCCGQRLNIWISDGGNIDIGHNSWFTGSIHIACIEGKNVIIGDKCLFSDGITIRSGDSHSVLNLSGDRINASKDICIGNHVWVGQDVKILKGSTIGNDCIIGTGSIITGKNFNSNCAIAGNPAKVIKEQVTWDPNLL